MQKHHLPLLAVVVLGTYAHAAGQTPAAAPVPAAPAAGAIWADQQAPRPPRPPRPPRAPRGPEKTETVSRTFAVGAGASLVLSNITGDISVSAGTANEIRVDATKRARGRDDADAAAQLAATRVQFNEFGSRIEVRTSYTETHTRVAVDYTVRVPAAAMVEVKSVGGDIVVTGVEGDVRAETVSGEVTASGLAREAQLKSVSGDVEVRDSRVEGDLQAQSVSGSVVGSRIQARTITAGTVSGDVGLRDASCEKAVIHSISGEVEYSGALSPRGRYELKSHSGDVRIAVDGQVGFELEANSFSGAIRTELPLTVRGAATRRGPQRSLLGVYGDGSAQISASTFSGSIEVVRR